MFQVIPESLSFFLTSSRKLTGYRQPLKLLSSIGYLHYLFCHLFVLSSLFWHSSFMNDLSLFCFQAIFQYRGTSRKVLSSDVYEWKFLCILFEWDTSDKRDDGRCNRGHLWQCSTSFRKEGRTYLYVLFRYQFLLLRRRWLLLFILFLSKFECQLIRV